MYKKFLLTGACLIASLVSSTTFAYYTNSSFQGAPKYVYEGILKYNLIKLKMNKAEYLLDKKGLQAIPEIKKINLEDKGVAGIFVIDPTSGQVIVAPDPDSKDYKDENINGKAISLAAIKNWQEEKRQGFWEEIGETYMSQYERFFTTVTVGLDGKAYVLASGAKDSDVQSLFVIELVKHACRLIEDQGFQTAVERFNDKNSIYKYDSKSYIFVYSDNGTCLYNPNYPELVGKEVPSSDSPEADYMKEMMQIADAQSEGWLEIKAKVPKSDKIQSKEFFFKSVFVDGKTYVVGSGVYLEDK